MSQLLFIGTGAADWNINDNGNFFRRFSSSLVNGELLLDCSDHIFDFALKTGNEGLFDNVSDILITHSHYDHFNKDTVLRLAQSRKIRVGCCKHIAQCIGQHPNIEFTTFTPYKTAAIGKYTVTPLLANHDVVIDGDNCAFHYIIETADSKKIFYGLDGAWFLRPSWEEMKKHVFDIMVLDCTAGDGHDWRIFEHNTIPMLRTMVKEISDRNMLAANGKLIASHLAKTLHKSHEETSEILARINMITAYDGLSIAF